MVVEMLSNPDFRGSLEILQTRESINQFVLTLGYDVSQLDDLNASRMADYLINYRRAYQLGLSKVDYGQVFREYLVDGKVEVSELEVIEAGATLNPEPAKHLNKLIEEYYLIECLFAFGLDEQYMSNEQGMKAIRMFESTDPVERLTLLKEIMISFYDQDVRENMDESIISEMWRDIADCSSSNPYSKIAMALQLNKFLATSADVLEELENLGIVYGN